MNKIQIARFLAAVFNIAREALKHRNSTQVLKSQEHKMYVARKAAAKRARLRG